MTTTTFKNWLLAFKDVVSPIGDLARDAHSDNHFPTSDDPKVIYHYLIKLGASDSVLYAFQDAYCYYCLECRIQPVQSHLERAVRHIWE